MCFNTQLIPTVPESAYKTGYQHERIADMFVHMFHDFDILCLQEVWGVATCELKDVLICYAQKAGFIYHATNKAIDNQLSSRYLADSGLLILSRFPIIKTDFHRYSFGFGKDNDAKRSVLFCKIQIKEGVVINVFNTHLQANNHDLPPAH